MFLLALQHRSHVRRSSSPGWPTGSNRTRKETRSRADLGHLCLAEVNPPSAELQMQEHVGQDPAELSQPSADLQVLENT